MEKQNSQTPVRETAAETRQGPLGRPMLKVLIGGLILAAIAWGAAEMFGESTDNNATISGQESPAAGQNKPSDQATPSGDQPTTNAPATSPTPQSGTGGDSQAKPPSSTPQ